MNTEAIRIMYTTIMKHKKKSKEKEIPFGFKIKDKVPRQGQSELRIFKKNAQPESLI